MMPLVRPKHRKSILSARSQTGPAIPDVQGNNPDSSKASPWRAEAVREGFEDLSLVGFCRSSNQVHAHGNYRAGMLTFAMTRVRLLTRETHPGERRT